MEFDTWHIWGVGHGVWGVVHGVRAVVHGGLIHGVHGTWSQVFL